jgi:hypothetical protein
MIPKIELLVRWERVLNFMRLKLSILTMFVFSAAALYAQDSETHLPVTLGVMVGVPITDMFSASNTTAFDNSIPNSPYTSATPRYELGVSGEIHLVKHLRLEVDGIWRRAGFATSGLYGLTGSDFYSTVRLNEWEVPALVKTNITLGHLRPFVEVGASLRHISGIQNDEFLPVLAYGITTNSTDALQNRNSFGGVAGFGITFKKGSVEISPEVRYTRWANESFEATGLRTNLDQGDALLGISF